MIEFTREMEEMEREMDRCLRIMSRITKAKIGLTHT